MKLKDICEIKSNFPEADFWLIRKGSKEKVGTPTKTFSSEYIGIKITPQGAEITIPDYLYRWFQFIQKKGFFGRHATRVLNLVHITSKFVGDIPVTF